MLTKKTIRPSDLVVRGIFLAIILVGGLADRLKLAGPAEEIATAPITRAAMLAVLPAANRAPRCHVLQRDTQRLLAALQNSVRWTPAQQRRLRCMEL